MRWFAANRYISYFMFAAWSKLSTHLQHLEITTLQYSLQLQLGIIRDDWTLPWHEHKRRNDKMKINYLDISTFDEWWNAEKRLWWRHEWNKVFEVTALISREKCFKSLVIVLSYTSPHDDMKIFRYLHPHIPLIWLPVSSFVCYILEENKQLIM